MDAKLQRKSDLEKLIKESLKLRSDMERLLQVEGDPRNRAKLRDQIEEQKGLQDEYRRELDSLDDPGTLAKYLNFLIKNNTDLNLRGVRQIVRQDSPPLDAVYISPRAEREITSREEAERRTKQPEEAERRTKQPEEAERRTKRAEFEAERRTEQIELNEAVRLHSRIVVLGPPGAGKTTLLRFLTLRFATAFINSETTVRDKEGNEYGEARLPIFCHLSDYAVAFAKGKRLRLRDFLPKPFTNLDSRKAISDLFNSALKRGNAFVMLSGLDEIIDAGDRAQIAREIEDFVAAIDARNRVIVTSRIAGYREAPLGGDYQHITLLDLEPDQIEKFLHHWYHATERLLSKDASEEEIARYARREIDGVLKVIDENPGVQRLAVNPLLLRILTQIHRNDWRLPSRRVELYDLAAKTLLEDWQLNRGIPSAKTVSEGEAAQFLWPLANWMHANKPRGLATKLEVKERLAAFLSSTRDEPEDHPDAIEAVNDFLKRVDEFTGILDERELGQYGFMHQTFEEYFAARELVRLSRDAARKIFEVRHDPRWEEPILLAIGFKSGSSPDDAADLIRTAILAEGEEAAKQGFTPSPREDILHRDLLFAARCIGDCASVDATLRQRVIGRLVRLYLDVEGEGKYKSLREKILACFDNFHGIEAANEAAEMFIPALRESKWNVRRVVAGALGELKFRTPEVVSGLLGLLRDTDEDVRRAAAVALGKIGTPEVVGGLPGLLRDTDEDLRRTVAQTLGELRVGTPEVVSGLLGLMRDSKWNVRRAAAEALGELRVGTPEVVSGLLGLLRISEGDVRRAAAVALGKIGTPEVVSGLPGLLLDTDEDLRRTVAQTLGELRVGTPEVVSGLLGLMRDSEWDVRRAAAVALGKIGTPEVVIRMLGLLRDSEWFVRRAAAEALGESKVGTPEVVRGMLGLLRDRAEPVRSAAVETLGELRVGTPEVVRGVLGLLHDSKWNVRRAAAEALGELRVGTPEVVTGLLVLLRDREGDVRRAAAGALGKIGTPEAVSTLLGLLHDNKSYARHATAEALGELRVGTPEVVSGLLGLLRDREGDVRRAAAGALAVLCLAHAKKLQKELKDEIAEAMESALADPQEFGEGIRVRYNYYPHAYDALWEVLWLVS